MSVSDEHTDFQYAQGVYMAWFKMRKWFENKRKKQVQPVISFIIPFYASHNRLFDCIASVKQYCSMSYEIIIIDDGNKAYSYETLSADPLVKILYQEQNVGPGKCRNEGIKVATGKYVFFLDSDDEIIADPKLYLEASEDVMDDGDIIIGSLSDGKLDASLAKDLPKLTNLKKEARLIKLSAFTAHLYKADFLKSLPACFAEDTRTAEDTVFLSWAIPRAEKIILTDVALYQYNVEETSLTRSKVPGSPVKVEGFYRRFGVAAHHIIDALDNFPEAQNAKISQIFKYGIKGAQRFTESASEVDKEKVANILCAILERVDLSSATAVTERKRAKVYWDETFDHSIELLINKDFSGFFEFIARTPVRIFKGQKISG